MKNIVFIIILIIFSVSLSAENNNELIQDARKFSRMLRIVNEKEKGWKTNAFLKSVIDSKDYAQFTIADYISSIAVFIKEEFNWTVYFSAVKIFYNEKEFLVLLEGVHGAVTLHKQEELIKIVFPLKFEYYQALDPDGKRHIIVTGLPHLFEKYFFYKFTSSVETHRKVLKNKNVDKTFQKYLKNLFKKQ